MSYIGKNLVIAKFDKQIIVGDNTETVFSLNHVVVNANGLLVVYGGEVLEPNVDYALISANTEIEFLTFVPSSSVRLYVIYLTEKMNIASDTLSFTKAISFSNLAPNAKYTTTETVSGVAVGDFVQLSLNASLGNLNLYGYVSSENTVTIVFHNNNASGNISLTANVFGRITKLN